jgi:hypothetical protein
LSLTLFALCVLCRRSVSRPPPLSVSLLHFPILIPVSPCPCAPSHISAYSLLNLLSNPQLPSPAPFSSECHHFTHSTTKDGLDQEILQMSTSDLEMRCRLLEDEVKVRPWRISLAPHLFLLEISSTSALVPPRLPLSHFFLLPSSPLSPQLMRSEVSRLHHENLSMNEAIKVSIPNAFFRRPRARRCICASHSFSHIHPFFAFQSNKEKIKQNKQLPYLVSNVVEVRGAAEKRKKPPSRTSAPSPTPSPPSASPRRQLLDVDDEVGCARWAACLLILNAWPAALKPSAPILLHRCRNSSTAARWMPTLHARASAPSSRRLPVR